MSTSAQAPAVPRLTYLRIKNYRALRDVEFRDLTPLTVLIGPNGSGKSTVLDALDFLAEAVRGNLVGAWEKRNRFVGMRTRGSDGAIEFELGLIANEQRTLLQYKLSIGESTDLVYIRDEKLTLLEEGGKERILFELYRAEPNYPHHKDVNKFLRHNIYENWAGNARIVRPSDTSILFGNTILPNQGNTVAKDILDFYELLLSYRLFHLTDDHLKGYSDAGPRSTLSPNGDNLPNVLYYLHLKHPEVLARIADKLRAWVPGLADVIPEITSDERLLLRFKDAPFEKPLPAQYMSGGTMRLAALLTLLYEPDATGLLGIEEPENELHPQLLGRLAEELIKATETRQLLVATHSPAILNALEPAQVWILHRGADGYTQATRAADLPGIPEMVEEGSPLGYLWTRNFFEVGDPLAAPKTTDGH
jgi:predicted ATPase